MLMQNRLLLILDLLRRKGTLTAFDLADKCGVSEGTIQKDIQTLSAVQIAERSAGGFRLCTPESWPYFDLTTDEMLSLYVGLSSDPVQSVGCFREAAKRVLSKIELLTPESFNGDYEIAKKHIAIQPERNRSHQGAALIFELVHQAIWPKQRIKLHYVSPQSTELVELTPKALLYKRDGWYLAGVSHKTIRYFRLDLIKNVMLC
jgi:predicted DNA-binding transcriptional regulator YafY